MPIWSCCWSSRVSTVILVSKYRIFLSTVKIHPSTSSPHTIVLPHYQTEDPGNLLRRTDGTLCILDFGMTLDVNPNLQYSLLEFVAHLTGENYDLLPEDLVGLGFLKPEKLDFARRSGALEPLKFFLKQAGQGGGADVVRERIIEQFRQKYPGLSDDEMRVEIRAEMKVSATVSICIVDIHHLDLS
jgi:hypothetical protein